MVIWQNDKLIKCQVDKMASWQNVKLTKCQEDKMTRRQNGWLVECLSATFGFTNNLETEQLVYLD
jgi:hypothetical protein